LNRCGFVMLAVLALAGWLVPGALAADFDGTSTGIFNNPVGGSGMVTSGVGTSTFTWGTPFGTINPSSLSFTGTAFSGFYETEFSFGTLDYYNGTIAGGSGADAVDLVATLAFTTPSGVTQNFTFTFQLINTPNTSDPEESADYVYLDQLFDPSASFTVGGVTYYLQFTRFAVASGGGFTTVHSFHVFEDDDATAQIFGKLTATPQTPIPGTALLLGSGLLGLTGWRRFRKS
jgi:hypothetical protein